MLITLAAAMAAVTLQQHTDTTVSVRPGTRLDLNDVSGDIQVRAWDRSAIRVSATHGSRDRIEITTSQAAVVVHSRSRRGSDANVTYEIWVPAATPLSLSGPSADIRVEGVTGSVTAETVEGDIDVHGGGGYVSLRSTEGDVTLEGANGQIEANSVEGAVTLTRVTGKVTIETVDGDVVLDGVDSDALDVSTVDGDITFRGAIKDGGRYRLTSHDGELDLTVPETFNATVSVATFDGDFEPDFPVTISGGRQGRRFTFIAGSGSAKVELESFDGDIKLHRGAAPPRRHRD